MKIRLFALMLLVAALVGCGAETATMAPTTGSTTGMNGASASVGDISLADVYARPGLQGELPAADAMANAPGVSAIFMTINNKGAADKLIKAESATAKKVELHTVVDNNGVMEMRPVETMDVPANGTLVLKPGSYHVMLLGLNQDLKVDDTFEATLTFEKAGVVTVKVPVRSVAGMSGAAPATNGSNAMLGDLTFADFYARPGLKGEEPAAGTAMANAPGVSAFFVTINNKGMADKLIKAESAIAKKVELHTVVDNNGVMEMRPVETMDVPANGTLVLKPGSYHVMLIGLNQDLNVDDTFDLSLTFEKAGMVKLSVPVKSVAMP